MKVRLVELDALNDDTNNSEGVAIVVDVIRAFSTQAAAFAAGAAEIVCVETLDDAFNLKSAWPDAILMGEERGEPPPGFDTGNSPETFEEGLIDPTGHRIIHRTSNGTRGLERSAQPVLYALAAVNAAATARHVLAHHADTPISILSTHPAGEDQACAAHLAALLRGESPDPKALADRVRTVGHDYHLRRLREVGALEQRIIAFTADIERVAQVDRYDVAIVGHRQSAASLDLGARWAGRSLVVLYPG